VLTRLHKKRIIEYKRRESCIILPTGLKIVEENFSEWGNQ